MKTSQLSHLYTIWRYDHNPATIIDHKEVLRKKEYVKWLVLCGANDRQLFEKSLPKEEVEKISKQANKKETVLYIQCLELFREQLFAGLIKKIHWGMTGPIEEDDLVPDYYKSLLQNKVLKLEVICSVLLTNLEPINSEEAFNLIDNNAGIPPKSSYNITRIVSQVETHSIFDKKSLKIRELTIDQKRRERCRAIAELLWENRPEITIEDMIYKDEITLIGCGTKNYHERVLRNWIKDLCPNRSPGRRPKSS
ncbi:MAG TPA: hypothetical protein PLB95_05630 [Syntrophales bacterium]|nr:hypothetical protein [Syntrophorhabdus sp.]HOH27332.1 hypothetical protein [Syntrophorhabdus sp.]HOQ42943.1 hypothetical protein [Smithellaceae bacterium]HPX81355.1 hypothetical protein [Syntrophales bacterium]